MYTQVTTNAYANNTVHCTKYIYTNNQNSFLANQSSRCQDLMII